MVDVSDKEITRRQARAGGSIQMQAETLDAVLRNAVRKGDVLSVARIAAIGGAKRASDLIPLCHPLTLDGIDVTMEANPSLPGIRIEVSVTTEGRTGVEMEALCGVSAGLLAVYDMCKSMDRDMVIESVQLLSKTGGQSGDWSRRED
jgi:cyclic pyranopterin phosphate synthase